MKANQSEGKIFKVFFSTSLFCIITISFCLFSVAPLWAISNADFTAVPPFLTTEVKPNVLFILDNSNSMDEDVNGAAVGGSSALSRSEIARKAIMQIMAENQETMRFGLMAYEQSGVTSRFIHNSFYYASYDSSTWHPDHAATPKDPSDNTKRFYLESPIDGFVYYDTALPFYSGNNEGFGFCYSGNYTEDHNSVNDVYRCYHSKTGTQATPAGLAASDETSFGYSDHFNNYYFVPTDSDFAAGFDQFGYEMSWTFVGPTWFVNSSPGGGILHVDIADSSESHLTELGAKLATSQFVDPTDTPLRNAGLTPIAGTINSALAYFEGNAVTTAAGVTATNPITLGCQKNFVIILTDGLPSVDSGGVTDDAAALLPEVEASITALRNTTNVNFSNDFDVKTYVVGFALPEGSGSLLDALAIAGGTADGNGNALLANNAVELAAKLKTIFRDISKKISSGAATSVISNSRSGEGVIYQSVFYPEFSDSSNNTVSWVGNVYSLFVDSFGNIREDTNHNQILDIYPDDDNQFAADGILNDAWSGNGIFDTEDQDGDWHLDVNEDLVDLGLGLAGNGVLDDEDVDDDGFVDIDEDYQEFPFYPEWYGNGELDDEDVDNDGHLDIDEDQVDYDIPAWFGNREFHPTPDDEDLDDDGRFETSDEDAQFIPGHVTWRGNGILDTEDVDDDGHLDATDEDQVNHGIGLDWWIGNGDLNTEDVDGDGLLDETDEDIDGDGNLDVMEDMDGDGELDTVDEDLVNHGSGLDWWIGNGLPNTEDVNNNGTLDTYDEDKILHPSPEYSWWQDNNEWNTEDTNNNGVLDTTNEDLISYGYSGWTGNGILDTEDVDGDGQLDLIDEDQRVYANHPTWTGNDILDDEDVDDDGFCDVIEDDQVIDGHGTWRYNGVLDTEDSNHNGILDAGEDTDGDGSLDTEDFDGDGLLSTSNEDINNNGYCDREDLNGDGYLDVNEDLNDNQVLDYEDLNHNDVIDVSEDLNGDGVLDDEDYNNNGIFERTEDIDGDGLLDTEDINGDGYLDVNEDIDGDGRLDVNEDLDGDGHLDVNEDLNGNQLLDTEDIDGDDHLDVDEDIDNDGILDDEDLDNDGHLDVNEDTNSNGELDAEDLDGDGHLDPNEDLNSNGVFDTEDIDGDGRLDVNEDRNGNGTIETEDYDGDGKLDYEEDVNHNGIVDTEDLDGDGHLDVDEDLNGNGILDYERDFNGNGVFDGTDYFIIYKHTVNGVVALRYNDTNANGRFDRDEDLNGNGTLDYDIDEDLNSNGILDPGEDLNGNNMLDTGLDEDRNGNGLLDVHEDLNNNGVLDAGEDLNGDGKLYVVDEFIGTVSLQEIAYVWGASNWLNEISEADIVKQRVYTQNDERRYLFTFIDQDNDKVVDSGEQIAFVTDDPEQPDNYDKLADYLVGLVHKSDEPEYVRDIRTDGNFNHFRVQQTKRTINFIRGKDQAEYTSTTSIPYTLDAMRSRVTDYDEDGTVETWRLGDVIHSSPTAIGKPVEKYHLLYDDTVYAQFADKYEKRRTMIYVGGNDGMIHAFNGGFFDSKTLAVKLHSTGISENFIDANNDGQYNTGETFFDLNGDGTYDDGAGSETAYPLGSEMWAYLPENLLPHLRWLTEQGYEHVYYNDLKARVVDAQIFIEEEACDDDIYSNACVHPGGWGTLLISGMRFGGAEFPKSATWDFGEDSAGWAFNNNAVSESFGGDAWTILNDTGYASANPSILSPSGLDIDASRIKSVEIRFLIAAGHNPEGAGGARLYWDSTGGGISNGASVQIDAPSVDTSGNYFTYKFDMEDAAGWSGTIHQIRIDIVGALLDSSQLSIDYVDLGDGKGYASSYVLMDITNPEIAPSVLAEVNLLGLGFTTGLPTVIPLKSRTDSSKNDWYMVFGSGPNHNSLADHSTLTNADSNMPGRVFVLSLSNLIAEQKISMLDSGGVLMDGLETFSTIDADTYVSDFLTVDFDLDYDADIVYYGTVSGNETNGWGGKLRRLILSDGDTNTLNWTPDSTLFTVGNNQSITAKPNVSFDNLSNFWVYFGTGRYFTRDDIFITDPQKYFGIKEPTRRNENNQLVDSDGDLIPRGSNGMPSVPPSTYLTWAEVTPDSLLNTTDAVVYDDKTVAQMGSLDTWDKLIDEIDQNRHGWQIDLGLTSRQRERNLGQAAVLGEIVTFTTYQPSYDPCSTDGWSYGFGLYYKTGTAYYKSIFGFTLDDKNGSGTADEKGEKAIDSGFLIGKGMSLSAAIHSGRQKGSTAFIQTSGGAIVQIAEDNPGLTKSVKTSWGQLK